MRTGKMKDLTRFDAEFFGYPPALAERADPQQRMLLEVVYESIVDAGAYTRNDVVYFLVQLDWFRDISNFQAMQWRVRVTRFVELPRFCFLFSIFDDIVLYSQEFKRIPSVNRF